MLSGFHKTVDWVQTTTQIPYFNHLLKNTWSSIPHCLSYVCCLLQISTKYFFTLVTNILRAGLPSGGFHEELVLKYGTSLNSQFG